MTVTTTERTPAAERIAVRCVDSDVHPTPKSGVLAQYIPEPWRSKYFLSRRVGDQIYYDAPDYAHARAMRIDTFPADGGFPGSDPDLALQQAIIEGGSDIGVLEPGFAFLQKPFTPAGLSSKVREVLDTSAKPRTATVKKR